MSTPFSAAEAQTARDYAAANSGINTSTPTSSTLRDARSLARALSNAATAIACDVALVTEGIEDAGIDEREREEAITEEAEVEEEPRLPPEADGARAPKTKTSTATRDKLSFLVVVLAFGMSAFYLGAFPVSFVRCFIFLAAVLLVRATLSTSRRSSICTCSTFVTSSTGCGFFTSFSCRARCS